MRVRHVSVAGLFGVFNHEIPLQDEGRITILHGKNGTGKTITLRMIAETLGNKDYDVLVNVPYECFTLKFDDGAALATTSLKAPVAANKNVARFTWTLDGVEGKHSQASGPIYYGEQPWLRDLRSSIHIRLLQTTRLLSPPYEDASALTPTVPRYSEHLVELIEKQRSNYVELSQELDQSFPKRILAPNGAPSLSPDTIKARLEELRLRHDELHALGILSPSTEMIRDVPQETDSSTLRALSVYVHDTERKLTVFDDLASRIRVLTDIVNSRFSFKHFAVQRHKGFVLTTPRGDLLPLKGLSSGEQHELTMIYDLLFMTAPDTLILIDEPEISLHLEWQQRFLHDLERIVELAKVDVIVATHSADIIDEYWPWVVSLEGPKP